MTHDGSSDALLTSLTLQSFRNHTKQTFQFGSGISIILGPNGRGKTNLLEAIVLLATGKSFRAQRIEEMVQWGKEVGRVSAEIEGYKLEVVVNTGQVQGQHVQKRKFLVDGVSRRRTEFIGKFSVVIFRPEDMELVTGSPSMRRKYLDDVLSQASQEYRRSLESYEKALKRRNALLDLLRDGRATRTAFTFWDQLLIKHGNVLTTQRRSYLEALNNWSESQKKFPLSFDVTYDPSTISESRLHTYAIQEVAAGYTLVGPHKDEFIVSLNSHPIEQFGSRGEQRMAVLWLKLFEIEHLAKETGRRPILLLDDIFSELDHARQEMVLKIAQQQQTICATTEQEVFDRVPLQYTYVLK
jgi:DNA replication and repair protein RecF